MNHRKKPPEPPASEMLILADGTVFAHNLTPAMARLLSDLNPADEAMNHRAHPQEIFDHELPS